MTTTSIQSISESGPVLPNSTLSTSSAQARAPSISTDDKVEFSAKAKARSLKQHDQTQQNVSHASSGNSALGTPTESATAHSASSTHLSIAQLSTVERAKLLKQEGDPVPQISMELSVPAKTIEAFLESPLS